MLFRQNQAPVGWQAGLELREQRLFEIPALESMAFKQTLVDETAVDERR